MPTVLGYFAVAVLAVIALTCMGIGGSALVLAAVAVTVVFAALVVAHHAPQLLPRLLEALGRLRPW